MCLKENVGCVIMVSEIMFIKLNVLVAVFVNVSWKTTFDFDEFNEFLEFLKIDYARSGDQLKVILSDSLPKELSHDIEYNYDPKTNTISCPKGIGVKENYDYLTSIMSPEYIKKFSDATHRFFNEKYHSKFPQM